MLTYPKSRMRVRHIPMHLSSGHVNLMPGKFYPTPNFPQSELRRRADSRWALPQISSIVYKLSLNYRSFKAIAGCLPDSSSSRTAHQHTQHTTPHSAQNWLQASCPDIITNDQWPPISPNINTMDYFVLGAMLEAYRKLKPKLKTSA